MIIFPNFYYLFIIVSMKIALCLLNVVKFPINFSRIFPKKNLILRNSLINNYNFGMEMEMEMGK